MNARIRISAALVDWADLIFVMEKRHKEQLRDKFCFSLQDKKIVILDIPDEYPYMDTELIEILKTSVSQYLQ